jgi:hypothetical protein
MNRYVVSMALALLLAGGEALAGQTVARVEYRNGGIGVSVAVGDLPVRIRPHASAAVGWVAADWGPIRVWMTGARPVWRREVLSRQDLRFVLGNETLRRIERHARDMGLRGPLEGRWFRTDPYTTLLEVGVRGVAVAELYDYGNDGTMDRILLSRPYGAAPNHGVVRYKEGYGTRGRGNRKNPW